MFVSPYNTYINTNSSEKTTNKKIENAKPTDNLFQSKLAQNSVIESRDTKNLPINYISNYKAFSNKQKVQEQAENKDEVKYTKLNTLKNAKEAYADNFTMFSFLIEPKATLSQTPIIEDSLSSELKKAQEKNIRHTMVNTYIANDKYYQVTA
ncbi:MAG: hypothetical protein ACJAWW_002806 [Sulfurimonas sp.]